MIWLAMMFATMVFVQAIRSKSTLTAAYYEGYRAAVKDSVRILDKARDDKFTEHAPYGHIMEPLRYSSDVGELRDRIKQLAQQIGRPL